MGEVEQRVSCSGVCLISILEGGEGEPEQPVSLSVVDEHSEIVLDFLIDLFCLSICLRMVRGARRSFYVELLVQIFNEHGYEDGSAVRNDFSGYAVHADDVLDKQVRPSFRIERIRGRDRNNVFGLHVYYYKDGIMSMCLREVRDHVYRDVFPVPGWNRVGVKRHGVCLSVDFGSLTGGASFDVVYDVVAKGAPVV